MTALVPPAEAIQTVDVSTSNFDPEFLRERRSQLEGWLQTILGLTVRDQLVVVVSVLGSGVGGCGQHQRHLHPSECWL